MTTATARADAGPAAATHAPGEPLPYAGFATRTVATAADAVVINVIAGFVGVVVGLALSLVHVGKSATVVLAAIGGVAYVLWVVGYFVTCWTTTGQTPGSRLMRVRVLDASTARAPLRVYQALLRIIGGLLSALLLCAGFLLILIDDERRGLHDRIAHTVVVYTPEKEPPAPRRPSGGNGAR